MYAILDIETTGGKFNEEGITEIAIHKFDGQKVVDKFISLVNPEKEIQPFVVKLTGINSKMLQTAPKFYEVAKRIIEITEDTVLVAHNAQFDYRILRTEFRRLGYNFERKTLCTVDLSKLLLPDAESYSLGKLVRSLGIPVSDRHRANGDALATIKLFKLLLAKDSEKIIFSRKYSDGFFDHCKKNIKKIVKTLLSEAYYEFKLYDLNVVITIDDLVNANGNRIIGEYDDEMNELRIVLFSYFKRFLDGLDDLSELTKDEKELIGGGITNILITADNEFAKNNQDSIKQVFYHEMTHHYDNIKYTT